METMIERVLETLGRNSIEAGVLVLVVLLTQRCLGNRIAARWRCALWLLVMGRLLLPVSIGSGASVFNLFPHLGNQPSMAFQPVPPEVKPVVVPTLLAAPSAEPRPLIGLEAPPETTRLPDHVTGAQVSPLPEPSKPETKPIVTAGPGLRITWPLVLFAMWLAGVLGFGGYVLVSSMRIHRRFAGLAPLTDPDLLDSVRSYRQSLGIRGELPLAESPDVATPALYGFVRPRLLLPSGFTGHFSANELRFILFHELAHVKRRDILFNWLAAGLQIVHWFNPLIWFGFARWRADRELACDELALEAAGAGHNREYGETILRLLENFTPRATVPGLVGILEDKKQLQRRILSIGKFRPGKKFGIVSTALFAGLSLVCLTDAQLTRPKAAPESEESLATNNQATAATEIWRGADPAMMTEDTHTPVKTMTVIVKDAQTGQPIPDAEISSPYFAAAVGNKPQPQRLTDAQGRYVLLLQVPLDFAQRTLSSLTLNASHRNYGGRSTVWNAGTANVLTTLPDAATLKLEPGVSVGGVVRDERGAPLASVRVLLLGSGYRSTMGARHMNSGNYADVSRNSKADPAAVTDAAGHWTFAGLPADVDTVHITLVRPDDAQESFSTEPDFGSDLQTAPISMTELRAGKSVFVMREGATVRGLVVDESGRPLSGVSIEEGYGRNIKRVSSFRTDAHGQFTRFHRVPRQWIYTASKEGRATTSVVAQVEPQMPDVRIVMAPAKPLRIRLIDDAGKPVAGVAITTLPSFYTEGQILDWKAQTDAQGLAIWSNAPATKVTFRALSPLFGERRFSASAVAGEKMLVLSQPDSAEATVQVNASDAKTGAPVNIRSVAASYGRNRDFITLSEPNASRATVKIKAASFDVDPWPAYRIRVQAVGYEPLVTEYLDLDDGHQTLAAALIPSGSPNGVAFQPDGAPAAGAQMWVQTAEQNATLFRFESGQYYANGLDETAVKADGQFTLPIAPAESPVVFASEKGYKETTVKAIQRTHQVRLEPWGRVEGIMKIAGQPAAGVPVGLRALFWTPQVGLHVGCETTTAPDGRFVFTQVPAGEYKVYRAPSQRPGGIMAEDHQMPLIVKAGETTQIEYAQAGRAVVGQAMPDKPEVAVDWMNDTHKLTLKQPAIPTVRSEDFASDKAFREAYYRSYHKPERRQLARTARMYKLIFEPDGAFRAEDVPPGVYELKIRVTEPDPNHHDESMLYGGNEWGILTREVVIPPGDIPFDLGTLVIPISVDQLTNTGTKQSRATY